MKTQIKKWGHSAAIRIPAKMLAQLHLEITSPVSIEVIEGKLEIVPAQTKISRVKLPFSESDLLKGLDSYTAHSDALAEPMPSEVDF